jgi:hypothetical protein
MAVVGDDIRDREVWTQVSRQWYLKASSKNPQIGRLYHHLAILVHPNAFQQFLYSLDDTWIGCLDALERYRMAIKDEDIRDRRYGPKSLGNDTPRHLVGTGTSEGFIITSPSWHRRTRLHQRDMDRVP